MNSHEEAPPLNPWPFLVGDAALFATACLVYNQAQSPLTGLPLIVIASCVALGAVLAVTPFVINDSRRQELALAERQREIAALAQTTATSAEQLSIAAASLHGIAENAARAAKLVEHLPHKIQDKINEFKTQLNEVAVTENESLSQEINTLRASETERLETALAGVRKTAADLAMIEAVSRKHLVELNETLARFASVAEKSAGDAAKTIDSARIAAEKNLASALKNAVADALAQVDRRFAPPAVHVAPTPSVPSANPDETAARQESLPPQSTVTDKSTPPFPASSLENSPAPPIAAEPATTTASQQSHEHAPVAVAERPARRRLPKKSPAEDPELTLGIDMGANDFSQNFPDDRASAVSADGLTRLLVTAYIGIGNKLYARGEGPGLTWDQGVPLQFVSIGKWRWETADASAPVALKIFKNDEHECTALGTVALQPGHQHEVTASFN